MNMEYKKISVIMGIYNCESTLQEAVESILLQSYKNWELIMCDDGSIDNTLNIAKNYEEKYPDRIKVIKNNENLRLAATLNHCLKYADGEYIARMDGDDISLPNRFEEQINFLIRNPEYDLVGSKMISFNELGEIGVKNIIEKPDKFQLKYTAPFAHATILCKREVYTVLQGYRVSKEVTRCEDIDLWFRFFDAGFSGYNLQKPLYKVREDKNAFKRRSVSSGINAAKVCFKGYKLLNYPKWDYIYLLKPIISSTLPGWVMQKYHLIKAKSN